MSSFHYFPPGSVLGDFEIVRPLSQGGMGTVYVARQRATGAQRALKVMRAGMIGDPRLRARFEQEARVSSLIHSDHVVQVVAAGIDEGSGFPWLAMELLEGQDLGAYLAAVKSLSPAEVAVIVTQLGHALSAAHEVGVVHRDLKPDNIFLARARIVGVPFVVKVLDFGVAKLVSEAGGATMALGTPAYMAPEQSMVGAQVGPSTDVWALGLILYRLWTGKSFWKAAQVTEAPPAALWREALIDPIPLASARAAEQGVSGMLPAGFDGWFARCVAREPQDRFANAAEACAALSPMLTPYVPASAALSPSMVSAGGGARGPLSDQTTHPSLSRGGEAMGGGPSPAPEAAEAAAAATVAAAVAAVAATMDVTPTGRTDTPGTGKTGKRPRSLTRARVTFREKFEKTIVEAGFGATLLETSLENGIAHTHVCGGRAQCTTCRVVVLEGQQNLGPRTDAERRVAERKGWPENIRLACQATVEGDVSVRRLIVDADDESLVADEQAGGEPAAEVRAVALACAIKDFGAFVQGNLLHDVVHVVNRYLKLVCEPILANRGKLDAYRGEAVTALFGLAVPSGTTPAPLGFEAPAALDALRAALRMHARVKQLNQYLTRNFGAELEVAIGLHEGPMVMAEVGHPSRRERVALGDTVEHALRLARGSFGSGVKIAASPSLSASLGPEIRAGRSLSLEGGVEAIEIIDFKRPDAVYLVQSTFERVAPRADEVAGIFYERLFELQPGLAPLFEHVDMAVQRMMLMKTLATAVRGLDQMDALIPTLQDLGRRHVGYGAKPVHYKHVGQALIETLERFFGPEFTPEVHLAWLEIYGFIARHMIEGSRGPAALSVA